MKKKLFSWKKKILMKKNKKILMKNQKIFLKKKISQRQLMKNQKDFLKKKLLKIFSNQETLKTWLKIFSSHWKVNNVKKCFHRKVSIREIPVYFYHTEELCSKSLSPLILFCVCLHSSKNVVFVNIASTAWANNYLFDDWKVF